MFFKQMMDHAEMFLPGGDDVTEWRPPEPPAPPAPPAGKAPPEPAAAAAAAADDSEPETIHFVCYGWKHGADVQPTNLTDWVDCEPIRLQHPQWRSDETAWACCGRNGKILLEV